MAALVGNRRSSALVNEISHKMWIISGERIKGVNAYAVKSRDIRLWRLSYIARSFRVDCRSLETFSDPEKTPCYVYVDILP